MNWWSKVYQKHGAKAPDSDFRAEPATFAARSMSKPKLHDLLAALQQDLDRLEEGTLQLSELQEATDHARTLYERLLVLNYLAQERLVKGDKEHTKIPFRLNAIHPGQTSLIDAIEEVSKGDRSDDGQPQLPLQQPTSQDEHNDRAAEEISKGAQRLKFNSPQAEEPLVSPQAKQEVSKPQKKPEPVREQPAKPVKKVTPPAEEASLADKLRRTPIEDLRKAISLNQKFQFIKSFFEGDAAMYDRLIDEVNGASDLGEAIAKVEVHVPGIEQKAEEDEVAASLLDLIERRFL